MSRGGLLLIAASLLPAALLVAACGGASKDVFDEPPESAKLAVRLDEYKVETRPGEATEAVTRLATQNTGTIAHELKVVRTDLAADALPQKGGVVDESQLQVVAKSKELKRRDKATLDVKLQPGSYVLICNISGHYALGMHAGIKVVASAGSAPY